MNSKMIKLYDKVILQAIVSSQHMGPVEQNFQKADLTGQCMLNYLNRLATTNYLTNHKTPIK